MVAPLAVLLCGAWILADAANFANTVPGSEHRGFETRKIAFIGGTPQLQATRLPTHGAGCAIMPLGAKAGLICSTPDFRVPPITTTTWSMQQRSSCLRRTQPLYERPWQSGIRPRRGSLLASSPGASGGRSRKEESIKPVSLIPWLTYASSPYRDARTRSTAHRLIIYALSDSMALTILILKVAEAMYIA